MEAIKVKYEKLPMMGNPENRLSVVGFFAEQIESCRANRQLGTARNYERSLASFRKFLKGEDISFAKLTEHLVLKYEEWLLGKGLSRNSTSFYLRNLRSIYNKAVARKLTTQAFPFQHVYTGVDKTRKRAVAEEVILQLQKLDLQQSKALALSRDLFIFSFCARGMAFVDMAFLRKTDVQDGVIRYVRRKTGQQLFVRVEPCIGRIMRRYAEETKDSKYVFPILEGNEPEALYKQYQIALCYHNRKLKRLSEMLGDNLSLSSYTARHTWATVARRHNVPLSIISEGMGHTSEKTTRIYLASLENSAIDEANKLILNRLNGVGSI